MQNVSDVNFTLAEVKLTEKQHASLELQSLNTKTKQVSRKKNTKKTKQMSVTEGWISRWFIEFEENLFVIIKKNAHFIMLMVIASLQTD